MDYTAFDTRQVLALNAALDADSTNRQLRAALADAMRDAGDPRSDGVLAMARCDLASGYARVFQGYTWWIRDEMSPYLPHHSQLPRIWIKKNFSVLHIGFKLTRREADDAAASAFIKLADRWRKQYLLGELD